MEDVVIIGAGPAGLAVAYQLSRLGIRYRLVDAGRELASAWRARHPQLRLNTLRVFSHQPGWRIPRRFGRWVSRDDYVRYLEEYARRFAIAVELDTRVHSLTRVSDGWALESSRGMIASRHVVVCTGANRVRRMPALPGLESFRGIVRHAEEFGSADSYDGLRVLIIGGGNSAFDIGSHLAGRPVKELVMSIRTPPSVVPKEVLGLPLHLLSVLGRSLPRSMQDRSVRLLGRALPGDLSAAGIGRPIEGAYTRHARDGVTIAIDDGFLRAVSDGRARIVPEIVRVDGDAAFTRDSEELRPDVIICATGYTPGLEPLVGALGVLDDSGFPTVIGAGSRADLPGLWVLGVRGYIWGNMHEQRRQSRQLARAIAARLRRASVRRALS
jgi:cation diffusion facilitator CzcD-associated flavoprotein CzcO